METLIPYDTEMKSFQYLRNILPILIPELIVVPQISNVSNALRLHLSVFQYFVPSSPFSHHLSWGPMRTASIP